MNADALKKVKIFKHYRLRIIDFGLEVPDVQRWLQRSQLLFNKLIS